MATSPLRPRHEALGARFTDFGGWDMPVQYEGVLTEHGAVRNSVGIFDVTHLGRFELAGSGTTPALLRLLCNDITAIPPGRAQYTMALNDRGGVEDDIIVWRWEEDRVWVLPNGVNLEKIQAMFAAEPNVTVTPRRETTVMLAVQGPQAPALIGQVLGDAPGRFRLLETTFLGHDVWAGGTGYTGERGAEVSIDVDGAPELWDAFVGAGATPCGLGARDTLRLEMGYPLWGQDLDPDTTPLEARLDWVVSWDHDFVGKPALEVQRDHGVPKRLVGFTTGSRQVARHGYPMRSGPSSGTVTSGNFSPTLGTGIGLGYLAPPVDAGAEIEVEIRGRWVAVDQAEPPFINR